MLEPLYLRNYTIEVIIYIFYYLAICKAFNILFIVDNNI